MSFRRKTMDIQEKIGQVKGKINGYKASRIISAAEQLKIFDTLCNTPAASNEIANELNIQIEKLETILYALVSLGLVQMNRKGFYIEEYFDILNPSAPRNQLGYIRHATTMMKKWENLTLAAKNTQIKIENFEAITGEEEKATEAFIQAMNANAIPQAKYIVTHFEFHHSMILDIGAGAGTYSIAVGKQFPSAHGVLLDLPSVSKIIAGNIQMNHLGDRFHVVSHDYNDGLDQNQSYSDVFLFAVAHQENDGNLDNLLKRVFDRLKPGGRLFLSSFFLNDDKASPEFSVFFAVEMLVMSPNGKVYTHTEIDGKLRNAGFLDIKRIDDVPGPSTLYIAGK